jgi:uncharacterized protein (DUF169 family)
MNKFFPCKFIGVRFTDKLTKKESAINQKASDELYCTAIAKTIKHHGIIVIDTLRHKCAGGNYFVGNKYCPLKEIADIYMNKECIFQSQNNLKTFLKKTGRNPIKSRYIIFEPSIIRKTAKIVIIVTTPDIAGRIIGLAAYTGHLTPDIIPAASTCSAIFRPLINPQSVHVNFIDYFDREYQCKNMYGKNHLMTSMTAELFKTLVKSYPKSCHGCKKPKGISVYKA